MEQTVRKVDEKEQKKTKNKTKKRERYTLTNNTIVKKLNKNLKITKQI